MEYDNSGKREGGEAIIGVLSFYRVLFLCGIGVWARSIEALRNSRSTSGESSRYEGSVLGLVKCTKYKRVRGCVARSISQI